MTDGDLYKQIERILDEHSAWITRPSELMGLGLLLLWPVAWAIILYWLWEDRNDE